MSKDISSFEVFEVLRVVGYVFLSALSKIENVFIQKSWDIFQFFIWMQARWI